jgi:hypothetical protein
MSQDVDAISSLWHPGHAGSITAFPKGSGAGARRRIVPCPESVWA